MNKEDKKNERKWVSELGKEDKKYNSNVRPFVKKIGNSIGEFVYLVTGKNNSEPVWHYVEVQKNKLPLFLKDIEQHEIDIAKYGKVLYSGWGETPPDDITKKVKETYETS